MPNGTQSIFVGDQSSLMMHLNSSDSGEFKMPFDLAAASKFKDEDNNTTIFLDEAR